MSDTNERPVESAGSQPEVWGIQWSDSSRVDDEFCFDSSGSAETYLQHTDADGTVVPLYRQPQPTLTEEEREAVRRAIFRCNVSARARRLSGMDDLADEDRKDAKTFSGLLANGPTHWMPMPPPPEVK